jgi:hypothetical protein
LTARVTPDTLPQYYSETTRLLSQGIAPEETIALLRQVVSLFERSPDYLNQFLKQQVHMRLPLHASCQSDVFTVFLHIASVKPQMLSTAILEQISNAVPSLPDKALRLFSAYLCTVPEPPYLLNTWQALIRRSEFYLQSQLRIPYLQLLYTALKVQPTLKAAYLDHVRAIFRSILEAGESNAADLVLSIVYQDGAYSELFKAVKLEALLKNSETLEKGLVLIYRYHEEMVMTPNTVKLLTSVATTSKPAGYLLLWICENEAIALVFARGIVNWIGQNLPTLRMTVKLLILVARLPSHAQVVIECTRIAELFGRVVEAADQKVLPMIGRIVKLLPIDTTFVRHCDSFLEQYYGIVLATYRDAPALVQDAMMLTEWLARVAFSPFFLALLPIVKVAIETPGWTAASVSLITTLSAHASAREQLAPFTETIKSHAYEPQLASHVAFFVKNMQK